MKNKLIYKYIGKVLIGYSVVFVFPILVSLIYKESFLQYILPMAICLILGLLLCKIKSDKRDLHAKDGFIIVAISWIIIAMISALPFVFRYKINYIDSIFEATSGLTTTGATIFKNVEELEKNILFWRSLMHFVGGMGVLAFMMAIIPLSRDDKSMHLLKAEMPGPSVAKLVPSLKKTMFYLYGIYIGLSITEFILLIVGKMNAFDATLITMGTAGTGGFSLLNSSIATYSILNKWTVTIFMILFGVNFNIYFLILIKDFKTALKSEELKAYILIFLTAVLCIIINTYQLFSNLNEAILSGFFHASSLITSTGYSIGDINIFPSFSRIICILLMFISACAGSTCGGIKVSRLVILSKTIKRDILKIIHPNSVRTITFDGKKLDEEICKTNNTFIFLYIILILIIMLIVSLDKVSFETTLNAVLSTYANVGLCFNISNFSEFSIISKIALSIGMLLGRLEIFPIIVLFTDWKRKI
ncbi:MAG: TrkH family potassium uptake protein [Clostridia bacterium]|nr:TrkH family potassium uptake protein [Clostridia bacterium]